MAEQCPECGAPVDGAPWCGACGARIAPTEGAVAAGPSSGGGRSASHDDRPWGRRLAVLVVLGVVGSLVVLRGQTVPTVSTPSTPEAPTTGVDGEVLPPVLLPDRGDSGRQFAARGSTTWTRSDLALPAAVHDVRPAGAGHVLVGDQLLATPGGPAGRLRTLPVPALAGVFDDEGRWAVAEFGRVVLGDLSTTVVTVVPDGWRPAGAAVAWHDGQPVLRDADGRLGLLAGDGTARWRTDEPVTPTGPVGASWLAGTGADGGAVVVDLDDGRTVALGAPALAIVGDVAVTRQGDAAVTRPGDVVAVLLPDVREVWRRPATDAAWRAVGDALVARTSDGVTRVDPATGEELGRATGADVAATVDAVVVRGPEGLGASTWDGRSVWRLRLDEDAVLLAVDETRVAVRVSPPAGARLTVLEGATGSVVGDGILPTSGGRTLEVREDRLLVVDGGELAAVVDRDSGADVTAGPSLAEPSAPTLRFGVGGAAVEVDVGAATLRGRSDGATTWTLPFGSPLTAPPARAGTSVVALLADGTVTAIDPRSGEPRWRRKLASTPTAAASDGTMLLVGTADGEVLRLDPSGVVVTRTVVGTGAVEALAAGRPAAALLARALVGVDVDG